MRRCAGASRHGRRAGRPSKRPMMISRARSARRLGARRTPQVASVLAAAGSEKAAFELIATAAVAAGLLRWQQAIKALEEAGDAPA